jgi:hypothetical protein
LAVVLAVCGMPAAGAVEGTDGTGSSAQPPAAQTRVHAQAQSRDVPDLAMIIAGGTGQTTVLRSGRPAFARLRQLLQPTYTGTERVPEGWTEGRYPPVDFTVVWGLTGIGGWPQTNRPPGGDVAVERQDQLFVDPDGTPWIRSDPAPDVQDDDIRWHRAPRSVFVQLEQERVLAGLGESAAAGGSGEVAAQGDGGSWAAHRAWWAVPGLGVGLMIGAGGTLLIRRAAARQGAGPPREEPRQELIDLDR